MKEQKKRSKDPQIIVLLRAVAGGYLLYLAWGLREAAFSGEKLVYLLAMILFVVTGVPLVYFSVMKLYRGDFLRPGQSPDPSDEEAPEDPALLQKDDGEDVDAPE